MSVGVDSWGVDYALIDADGWLVEDPVCYRDSRTDGAMDEVFAVVPRAEIFARTGVQFHQFNTLYQLWAHVREGLPPRAAHLLLMPDWCHHVLCGSLSSERTNASTTQLIGAASGAWDDDLFSRLGLPGRLMPPIVSSGTVVGRSAGVLPGHDVAPLPSSHPTHDTASAVAGTPLRARWATSRRHVVVGRGRRDERSSRPILSQGLTNEAAVFGRVRLLTNVMGLWLSVVPPRVGGRGAAAGPPGAAGRGGAARSSRGHYPSGRSCLFAPASMVGAIRGMLRESDQPDTDDPVIITTLILDSLARRYAGVVAAIERLTGRAIPGIHIVGGGSMNRYPQSGHGGCVGPRGAGGPRGGDGHRGNLLVQGIAAGTIGSLADGRRMVAVGVSARALRATQPGRLGASRAAVRPDRAATARASGPRGTVIGAHPGAPARRP